MLQHTIYAIDCLFKVQYMHDEPQVLWDHETQKNIIMSVQPIEAVRWFSNLRM